MAILDASAKRLIEGGPEALRLQEVAAEVGITHSTVLHHFGSREQLLEEFTQHAVGLLQRELQQLVERVDATRPVSPEDSRAHSALLLDELARLLHERGYARLLAWLILCDRKLPKVAVGIFEDLSNALGRGPGGDERSSPPAEEDARVETTFAMTTLFGDALFGAFARSGTGLPADAEVGGALREWLASRMTERITLQNGEGC